MRNDEKLQFLKCLKDECDKYYCSKCSKLYKNVCFDYCYFCKKICTCTLCLTKLNHIQNFELAEVDEGKNLVKIDNYLIIENSGEVEEERDEDFSKIRIVHDDEDHLSSTFKSKIEDISIKGKDKLLNI